MKYSQVCCIMSKYVLLFILLFGIEGGYAQQVSENKRADRYFQTARLLLRTKHYQEALVSLDKVAGYDDRFAELYFLRADICDKLGDKNGELKAIEAGLAIDSVKYTAYYYFLGDGYFKQGHYWQALSAYQSYLRKDKKQMHAPSVRKQIVNCHFALNALAKGQPKFPELYIASEKNVYWPAIDVTQKIVLYTRLDEGVENIWRCGDTLDVPLNMNTSFNEGTQTLTADGKMMYFTGCGRPDSRGRCDIYVSYRLADTLWSEPINLGDPVNTDAWEAQPSISADGTKLFFASNREGGKGGSDIWYSTLVRREQNGRQIWSEPRTLYMNTAGEEMAPFLYYDGKSLFFASDGYPGMGGMDVYKVRLDSVNEPQNIGIGVNTQNDEMGIALDALGKWGYFASDRSGVKNIYRCLLPEEIACDETAYLLLSVKDEFGLPLLADQAVVTDLHSGDTLAYYNEEYMYSDLLACVPANSVLLISVLKSGYMYYSDTLRVGYAAYEQPLKRDVLMRGIKEGESLVLKGVFFNVDDYSLRPESKMELEQLTAFLQQNPEMKIEISGHTDNSGKDAYNAKLSGNRAFEVYKYLFLNRIKKDRMTCRGYGKTCPLAPNDTEEGRQLNRRTEIKVMSVN